MRRRVDQTVFASPASGDRLRDVMSSRHGEPNRIRRARTAPSPCAVVIADTRKLISEALGALIGAMTGCVLAGVIDADRAIATLQPRPDVAIVGVDPYADESLRLVEGLRRRRPDLPLVAVADRFDPPLLRFCIDRGVAAIVTTSTSGGELRTIMGEVVRGNVVLPVGWQRAMSAPEDTPIAGLSERQREVLELLAQGCSNEQIAERLFISPNTVKFHVRAIYARLDVHSRLAAARYISLQ
jgi:DNA-binding NarL/FixJ family response regulator